MHNFTDLRMAVAAESDTKKAIVALLIGIASNAQSCAPNQGAVEAFARELGANADGFADAVLFGAPAPAPSESKVDADELRTDGPTLEQFRAAGYTGSYPPDGYAANPAGTEAPALPETVQEADATDAPADQEIADPLQTADEQD